MLILLSLLFLSCQAYAQSLSLPLEGFYHPGRAMPVRWDATTAGGALALSATGAITTRIPSISQSHGTFPWLAISANITNVSDPTLPALHPISDDDLLVVDTLLNDHVTAESFSGHSASIVHLDASELTANPMAWQTVDLVILDSHSLQQISLSIRDQFLAQGIVFAVLSPARPDNNLPWRQQGPYWLASSRIPLPPIVVPDIQTPTYGWTPGRSVEFRRRVFLFAIIYCLLIAGIALWRSRWMVPTIIALTIASSLFFAFDNSRQSPIAQQIGTIFITGPIQFEDSWLFRLSHRAADFRVPIAGCVQPVFSNLNQLDLLNITLECNPTGQPITLTGHLLADESFAIMRRTQRITPIRPAAATPITTPLRFLATDSLYPHCKITGQLSTTSPNDPWAALIVSPE